MNLKTNIYKLSLLWLLLTGCTGYMLLACNNTEPKPIQKRKFILTKDSTFIGTWVGRAFMEEKFKRDSITLYFSLYSKDSILYMYRDYWRGKKLKREEPDSAILAWAMQWAEVLKFTDSMKARQNAIETPTFWLSNYIKNDSILYYYKGSGPSDSGKYVKNMTFLNGIEEYYKINSDNSLTFNYESNASLNTQERDLIIRYTLQPYEYKKQD